MNAADSSGTSARLGLSRPWPTDEIEYRLSAIFGYASLVACGAGLIKILF